MVLHGGHVLFLLAAINIVNFMDRGITPGAPHEFSAFVNSSLSVPMEDTAVWTGAIFSSFIGVYSVACVSFGHLLHSQPAFRLLSIGLCIWVYALAGSGLAYFFPRSPFAFWWYLLHRAISGVGEAAFQSIVPPYIEDIAPAGSKAKWLGVFYTAIPCGTAIGFIYGSLLAPSPPESIGWGWAYLLEAIVMAPCAVGIAWLPQTDLVLRRRVAKALKRGPLLDPLTGANGAASADTSLNSSPYSSPYSSPMESPAMVPPPTTTAVPTMAAGLPSPATAAALSSTAPPSSCRCLGRAWAEHTVMYQLGYLCTAPVYLLVVAGYAAQTATIMGISTFGANFALALGLFEEEATGSLAFGACAAVGGAVGTPLGGLFTDWVARSSLATARNAGGGGHRGQRLVELRALVGAITLLITLASMAIGGAAAVLFVPPVAAGRQQIPFLLLLTLGIGFTYGCSAGISRAVMLLVPSGMRAFALAFQTLLLHAVGDVPSPPIVGALASALGPSCVGTPSATCLGEDPHNGRQAYTPDQLGIVHVMLFAALYMTTAVVYWGSAYLIVLVRARRAAASATRVEPASSAAPPHAEEVQ